MHLSECRFLCLTGVQFHLGTQDMMMNGWMDIAFNHGHAFQLADGVAVERQQAKMASQSRAQSSVTYRNNFQSDHSPRGCHWTTRPAPGV